MKRYWLVLFVMIAVALPATGASAEGVPGTVLRHYSLSVKTPTGLAWDGQHFWVADLDGGTLSEIDPATGRDALHARRARVSATGTGVGRLAALGCGRSGQDRLCGRSEVRDHEARAAARYRRTQGDRVGRHGAVDGGRASRGHQPPRRRGRHHVQELSQPDGARAGRRVGPRLRRCLPMGERSLADAIYRVDPATGAVLDMFPSPGPYPAGLAWDGKHLWCVDYETRELGELETTSGSPYVVYEPKQETLAYTEAWRNFGPGTVTTLDVYIAVPHDLPNQKILTAPAFDPAPQDYVTDKWGQRCAHFVFKEIGAGESVSATMTVDATLYKVRWYVDPSKVGTLKEIPAEIRSTYTQNSSKLVMDDPIIQKAVTAALAGETNPYWMAWKINKYIQDHMHYELAGGWNVAPTVLERGSGSCSEYTFVMLAMCHAAGLPARYAGSVVVRNDDASRDDVFHRWVEVYLPNYGWFPIDPSGGDSETPAHVADFFGGLSNRFVDHDARRRGQRDPRLGLQQRRRLDCEGPRQADAAKGGGLGAGGEEIRTFGDRFAGGGLDEVEGNLQPQAGRLLRSRCPFRPPIDALLALHHPRHDEFAAQSGRVGMVALDGLVHHGLGVANSHARSD